jgi:hypothetical protein
MSHKASGGNGKQSLETRLKRSQAMKGRTSPMKGRKHRSESIELMTQKSKGRRHTDESRAKMSESQKGNTHNRGRKHTDQAKANMSKAQKGKIVSLETRLKQSKSHIGNKSAKRQEYVAISPERDFIYFVNAKAFCESNFGKLHKFSRPKISNCAKGKRPYHRKFQFYYVDDFFRDA